MASVTVEIVTSRAIAAQILRHRSFAFQEFSQRYSVATKLEDIQWRMQGKTNRQVGDAEVDLSPDKLELVNNALNSSLKAYDTLIEAGVAKECARMVLPLTTQTTMYMTGTLRSWIHYIELRAKEDTQKDHREIAVGIKNIFIKEFPVVSEALSWT
jgi:thymidylate synthase (FAD)